MEDKVEVVRRLFRKGKFSIHTTKDIERFTHIDGPDLMFQDKPFNLYIDQKTNALIYGNVETKQGDPFFTYLIFSPYEYSFNDNTSFEWFDAHEVGFNDLKQKK